MLVKTENFSRNCSIRENYTSPNEKQDGKKFRYSTQTKLGYSEKINMTNDEGKFHFLNPCNAVVQLSV